MSVVIPVRASPDLPTLARNSDVDMSRGYCQTEYMKDSRLRIIFLKLRALVGQKAWKPSSVDERTWRRWLSGNTKPSGHSAKIVAADVWAEFGATDGQRIRAAVFSAIREVVPDVSSESWNEETFCAWFFELAESERN